MINLINRLFNRKSKKFENISALESYFLEEIDKSGLFKEDSYKILISHLKGEIDIFNIGSKLSSEQKKEVRI